MKYSAMFLALTLALTLGVSAKPKSKKKAKVEEVKPDTLPNTTFSYAYGMANSQGLKQFLAQRQGVDTAYIADFLRGFDKGTGSPEDARMKAYITGLEIRQQVERDVMKKIDRQLSDNDTTAVLDRESFLQGFRSAVNGAETLIPMDSAMTVIKKQTDWYENRNMMAKYGEWKVQNEQYLADNAKGKDIKTTASGLQYRILTQGEGEVPTASQRVKVNYEGKLIDETVFDSSYKRNQPATFGCNQVIKGWTEALTMMPVGSKWELYIPQELAYGTRETGKIKPYSTLIFTVELLEIVK